MNALLARFSGARLHAIQQAAKWIVYSLLLINWGFYIYEDWDRAVHTLNSSSTVFEWGREFATSIDEAAWFILLLMFELETYMLADSAWTGWVSRTVHAVRIVCFVMIAHTVLAFAIAVNDLEPTVPVLGVDSLCDIVDDDISFVYNLDYTVVTADNCAALGGNTTMYRVGSDPVVSTIEGLNLERDIAWSDLVEVVTWLLIIAAIELVVRLQERGITSGTTISIAGKIKIFLYLVLFGLAAYWGSLGHWLYSWDTFVWIAGFTAIEMNIQEWRDEILEAHDPEPGGAAPEHEHYRR